MKIEIIQVAPTKNKSTLALEEDYESRLKKMCQLSVKTLKASKSDQRQRVQEEEKESILAALNTAATTVLLDERGKQFTSPELAKFIEKERDFGSGKLQFIIGGSHGTHPEIHEKADHILSFSKMTFPHELIRVFLKEQIYRGLCILAGKPYHK